MHLWKAQAARNQGDDGFRAAAANQRVWLAVEAIGGVLGQTEAGGPGSDLTWTGDGLLQQVVYLGLRADKPPREIVMECQPA
jgi:hypothetical protein